jgi:tetratricopeptide (TPR) repeat protein
MPAVAAASPQASTPSTPSAPSSSPAAGDPAVKDRMIADFKDETQSVLSRVTDATGNFREVDRLESVQKLPAPVSESVGSLVERGRDFRAKVGYETALQEYRAETETVDALAVVDQITRNIAANDASAASSRLADFLKSKPEPTAESEKALWRYLTSMRSLCSRLEKDADVHLQKAQSLASAGKKNDAIREYQEANRIFPKPATAEKIRQLQGNGPES